MTSVVTPDLSAYVHVQRVRQVLIAHFPYFAKIVDRRAEEFGAQWIGSFEKELATFFGRDDERLQNAVTGYGKFSLDAMKLQKKFDQSRAYIAKHYDEVAQDVYMNREYMFGLYLPGILLSHYLWPHHYQQLLLFHGSFVPLLQAQGARLFYDIGIGTGFYSKELLRALNTIRGRGYDISPFSLEHASIMATAWGVSDRYECRQQDILTTVPAEQADALVCVEVLEHLEDPVAFLKGLRKTLRPGALAFITAAVNAPNADHIYLYRSIRGIADELLSAGFWVVQMVETFAYQPKPGESVPSNGICIVEVPK